MQGQKQMCSPAQATSLTKRLCKTNPTSHLQPGASRGTKSHYFRKSHTVILKVPLILWKATAEEETVNSNMYISVAV